MTEERRRIWDLEWNRVNDGQLLNKHYETHKETQRWRGRFVRMGLIKRRMHTSIEERHEKLRVYKKQYYTFVMYYILLTYMQSYAGSNVYSLFGKGSFPQ